MLVFILLALLLIIVLFGGIKYYIFAEKRKCTYVKLKISFIRIFKFVFLLDENNGIKKSYFSILFFKFFKKGFTEKGLTEKVKKQYSEIKVEKGDSNVKTDEIKIFNDSNILDENINKINSKTNSDKNNVNKKYNNKKKNSNKNLNKKNNRKKNENNIFCSVKNIYNKFVYFKNYPQKKEIIKYSFNFIKELFFAVKPKELYINAVVGFDKPSNTGVFLGFAAIICEFIPFDIYLSGDFEKSFFEGNAKINGKTSVFRMGIPVLRFLLKKPIWNLLKNRKD